MARKKRDWYPGAEFHIVFRGVRRMKLFQKDEDYELFFHILQSVKEKYPFELYSYCLMTNHVHLLIKTFDAEIWKIMQMLLGNYGITYNHIYGYSGHVFEGRYTSKIVENGVYFLEASRCLAFAFYISWSSKNEIYLTFLRDSFNLE